MSRIECLALVSGWEVGKLGYNEWWGDWGIYSPNHPPFIVSKFSTSQPLTRARHSILDTPKVIKSSPIPHKALVISERDLSCSFELLRLDCFFLSHLFLRSKLNCNRGKRHQLCGGPCGEVLLPVDLRREAHSVRGTVWERERVEKDQAFVASSTGSRFARTEPR